MSQGAALIHKQERWFAHLDPESRKAPPLWGLLGSELLPLCGPFCFFGCTSVGREPHRTTAQRNTCIAVYNKLLPNHFWITHFLNLLANVFRVLMDNGWNLSLRGLERASPVVQDYSQSGLLSVESNSIIWRKTKYSCSVSVNYELWLVYSQAYWWFLKQTTSKAGQASFIDQTTIPVDTY